jgi:hypothetical protein
MDGEELGLIDGTGEAVETDSGSEESFIEESPGEGNEPSGEDAGTGDGESGDSNRGDGEGSHAIVKAEPLAIRKALREITTANPEFAKKFPNLEKSVTTALYKADQITKFGGLQKVSEAFEALEVHGGIEGLQDLVSEVELTRELEKGFERGDPKVVEGWAKDYPVGFKKLIAPAFDKLETVDKQHYEAVACYVLGKIFDNYGVFNTIAALGESLGAGKTEEAIASFNKVAKFLGSAKDLATKAKFGETDRDAELDEREKSIADRDKKAFYGSVRADVNTAVMSEMNRLIRLELPKGKMIKVDMANRLRKEINAELMRVVITRPGYAERYESVMNARDKDRAARFIISNAKQQLPKVVRQLVSEFGLKTPVTSRANSSATRRVVDGAARVIAGRPKTADIDFARTDKSTWLATMGSHGSAWLKNGKQAKW